MIVEETEKAVDAVAVRLGQGLRAARMDKGIAQAELARRLGVIPSYVLRWEKGERRIDLETVEEAERVMGLQPGTVLRLAGYVDDGQLIDLGSIPTNAQRSVRAILNEFGIEAGDDHGSNGSQGVS